MTPCPHSLHPPCSQSITVKRTWSPEFDQEEWLHTKPATPPSNHIHYSQWLLGFESQDLCNSCYASLDTSQRQFIHYSQNYLQSMPSLAKPHKCQLKKMFKASQQYTW